MKSLIRTCRHLAVGLVIAAAVMSPAQGAHAGPSNPEVPGTIAVPEGNKLFRVGHAVGVQIYSCNATSGGLKWEFVAPRADVYNDQGKLIMTHFGGPTWQAGDGSAVVGRREAGVNVDPTAVDWLLLSVASSSAGEGDQLTGTTFIQRTATSGGIAPDAAECNAETVGNQAEVPYTADYYFWKAKNS
ncbi:MAG TPA: DUF3455 domain-containing protein [Jiangellaceae bacterium]